MCEHTLLPCLCCLQANKQIELSWAKGEKKLPITPFSTYSICRQKMGEEGGSLYISILRNLRQERRKLYCKSGFCFPPLLFQSQAILPLQLLMMKPSKQLTKRERERAMMLQKCKSVGCHGHFLVHLMTKTTKTSHEAPSKQDSEHCDKNISQKKQFELFVGSLFSFQD